MPFDPTPHLTNKVKGGGLYLEVKYRLMWLREDFPASEIETEMVQLDLDQKLAIFRARVSIPEHGAATGYGSETERDFPAGWIEKAETKAIGRALAALGFGTQFALELDEGAVDSPAPSKPKAAAPMKRTDPPPARTAPTPAGGATTPTTQAPSFAAQAAGDIADAHAESVAALKEKVRAAAREDGYMLEKWSDWRQLGARLNVGDPGADPATLTTGWCKLVLSKLKAVSV